jgi:hypothetical protein
LNALAFSDLAAFAVRLLATGGVVLGITLAVGRLGATAGGMLAGLPIVVGPGLVFLAFKESDAFIGETATFALLSLCATQAFMLAYLAGARRFTPIVTVAFAFLAWLATALVLARIATGPLAALGLFAVSTLAARLAGKRLLIPGSPVRNRDSLLALLLRASLAGLLVGVIAAASTRLGPQLSGLLLAYPVGMTVIAASIHIRHGAATVMATLYATALGTTSLATFCFVVAISATSLGSGVALALGFAACICLTASLFAWARRTGARVGPA